MTLRKMQCWWIGFAGTWLNVGLWAMRIRMLLVPHGYPLAWPGITFDGHLYDTDHPRYVVEGEQEHQWMTCSRCGAELYCGWRRYYG